MLTLLREVWEFIQNHFDKLLLASLFVYMTILLLHLTHHAADAADVNWAREQANLVIGGLLGLVTGKRLAQIGNGKE